MAWNRRSLVGCSLVPMLVASVGLWSAESRACSPDPCQSAERFWSVELLTPAIPIGGVLVFQAYVSDGNGPDVELLDAIDVSVSVDGAAVAGQLEETPLFSGFVWSPNSPLEAGVSVDVSVSIDNTMIDDRSDCGEDLIEIDTTIEVADESPALPSLPVTPIQNVYPIQNQSLDTVVCCDGAYPTAEPYCGTVEILWNEGACVTIEETGRLNVGLSVDTPPTGAATANTLYRTVFADDSFGAYRHQPEGFEIWKEGPFCVRVEALSLVDGSTSLSDELCLGDDVVDQLGPQFVDPAEFIEMNCEGEPYVCETTDIDGVDGWDADDCTPFDGEPPDGGSDSGDSDTDSGGSDSDSDSDSGDSGPGGSDSDSGPDSGGDTDGGADLDDDAGGCACTAGSNSRMPVGLALSMFGLVALRRRKTS